MAKRENLTLGGFRAKLQRCSLEIEAETTRRVVKLRTSEPLSDLLERGEFLVADREPVGAAR
jgi:hypothetical protein